jgi:hypothetical protein
MPVGVHRIVLASRPTLLNNMQAPKLKQQESKLGGASIVQQIDGHSHRLKEETILQTSPTQYTPNLYKTAIPRTAKTYLPTQGEG